jgi:hypothetical protein
MLTISDSAAQGLKSLLVAVSPGEHAGVRISGCGDRCGALRFALDETGGGVSARSDEDRQRFADERRRVERPEKTEPDEDEPEDGPGEDAVREAQRDLGDAPPEAD